LGEEIEARKRCALSKLFYSSLNPLELSSAVVKPKSFLALAKVKLLYGMV
jgi:hypothetical protein